MLKTGDYLIDTNVVIHFLNKNDNDPEIEDIFSNVYIPSTVIGELMYGAYNSKRCGENIEKIVNFLADFFILDTNIDIAQKYGEIKSKLKKKGKPIPENDIWIAAFAINNNLTVITNDEHFNEVENLKLENLVKPRDFA